MALGTPTERNRQPDPMTSPTSKARSLAALRLTRAAAAAPTETIAEVCGLSDQALRKHLRNLPARGRCAATVAALAAAQKLPDPADSAAVAHWACPPPAVRAARPGDLDAVKAARGSASWALAHQPFRGGSIEFHAFISTARLHRSVTAAVAASSSRRLAAEDPLCPPAILERLAHDPNDDVRDAAAHTQRRCCCDEPPGRTCEAADTQKRAQEATNAYLQDIRQEYEITMSLRYL